MADRVQAALPAQTAGGATSVTVIGEISASGGSDNLAVRTSLTLPAGATTITGVATNNATFNFRQVRAGAVVQTFATVTLAVGNNLVAETPLVVPLAGSPSTLAPGDIIDVQMVQNGTGLAISAGVIATVDIE